MKTRSGFVSNSSSSSFVICKKDLTDEQANKIRALLDVASVEYEGTYYYESNDHFFGKISYHSDVGEALDLAGIKMDVGD